MSKFLKVKCDCDTQQIVFGDAKSKVACQKCGNILVEPSGGRANINCLILEVLG